MSDHVNGKYTPRPGKIPGVAFNLGGHIFVLAPLGLGLMRELEAKATELSNREPKASAEDFYELNVGAVVASLQRNYPEVTRESIADLLDSHNIQEAANLVLSQTGLKRVTPGELPPSQ